MDHDRDRNPELRFLRRLCAHLSEGEMRQAQEDFWSYIEIARGLFERSESEAGGRETRSRDSTDRPPDSTIES